MNKALNPIWIVIGVIVLLFAISVGNYNTLVRLDETTDSQWSQVEVQLKRRADLIPNLVNTVKGYASHEQDTFTKVIEARNGLTQAQGLEEVTQANQQLNTALSGLNVVVERYPELKANENFIRLQDQLEGTENRLAVARKDYNDSVRLLNSRVRRFPTNIIANMFGFSGKQYFEIEERDMETPNVEF